MAKRAEAMRAENERVKRQTEQRLARKRTEEAQKSGSATVSSVKNAAASVVSKNPILRNVNWGASGIAVLVASIILVVVLIVNKRRGAPEELPQVEPTVSNSVVDVPVLDTVEAVTPALEEVPSVVETIDFPPPSTPGEPLAPPIVPPPSIPSIPEPPPGPPKASMRWAALRLPEQCFQFPAAPHGVLPGLEHYDFSEKLAQSVVPIAQDSETLDGGDKTVSAAEEAGKNILDEIKEGVNTASSLLSDAVPAVTEALNQALGEQVTESESLGEQVTEPESEESSTEGGESGAGAQTLPVSEMDFQAAAPPQAHRRMLLQKRKAKGGRPEDVADPAAETQIQVQAQPAVQSAAQAENLLPTSTELQAMNLLLNVSAVDGACQFVTSECAEAAAMQLADALRADAEAVSSPKVSAAELKRVSENLATLHSNSRTLLNASELPSLGKNGALGNCAVSGEAEYDPVTGERYDAFTSRFAVAIDRHDVLVHCAETLHYCTVTHLQENPIRTETLRIDAQSFVAVKKSGQQLHELLAADLELGDGVAAWRHAGEPTHAFLTLMLLLRSGLCQRIDVYGQPGVPSSWYKNVGNGHIITVPANTEDGRSLAASLQQERFALRVAVHVFQGRLCFFK